MLSLTYLLQASLVLAILYGAYWLLLRREAFYGLNRLILLFIIGASSLLPLLPVPQWLSTPPHTLSAGKAWVAQQWPVFEPAASSGPGQATSSALEKEGSPPADAPKYTLGLAGWVKALYAVFAAAFLARLLFQLGLILNFLRQARLEQIPEGWLALTSRASVPFTFWNVVFLPSRYEDSPLRKYILQHERIHARQWHSADLLLSEAFCAFFWFHPLSWKLNRSIRLQLEYLADEAVLRSGADRKEYQYSLLSLATQKNGLRLTNPFNHSLIKTRIVMMNAKKSPALARLKYLMLLPLTLMLALFLNDATAQSTETTPQKRAVVAVGKASPSEASSGRVVVGKAQSINGTSVGSGEGSMAPAAGHESVFVVIAAEFPKERIPQLQADLKEQGVIVSFDELDYNAEGLITRVKLSVRTEDGSLYGNGFSENDGQPIEEPIVFYLSREDGQKSFGIFSGKPKGKLPPNVQRVLRDMHNGYFVGKVLMERE